jgi:hypothetical protein
MVFYNISARLILGKKKSVVKLTENMDDVNGTALQAKGCFKIILWYELFSLLNGPGWLMVFYNISAISWWLVLLVEESGVPQKTTDLPQVSP